MLGLVSPLLGVLSRDKLEVLVLASVLRIHDQVGLVERGNGSSSDSYNVIQTSCSYFSPSTSRTVPWALDLKMFPSNEKCWLGEPLGFSMVTSNKRIYKPLPRANSDLKSRKVCLCYLCLGTAAASVHDISTLGLHQPVLQLPQLVVPSVLVVEDEAAPTPGWWDCQLLLMVLVSEVMMVIEVKVVVMLAVGVVGGADLENSKISAS